MAACQQVSAEPHLHGSGTRIDGTDPRRTLVAAGCPWRTDPESKSGALVWTDGFLLLYRTHFHPGNGSPCARHAPPARFARIHDGYGHFAPHPLSNLHLV